MSKVKVENTNVFVHRAMGESHDWKKLNLKKKHVEALNEIGHSGKYKGKKMTLQQYFDKYIDSKESNKKMTIKHTVQMLSSNNMEFTDTYLVNKVTVIH